MALPVNTIVCGDALTVLKSWPDESVNCVVTSPPYFGLRDYGVDGQMGLERSPEQYVQNMTAVFEEVRRVLKADGTLWLNIGDSYAASGRMPAPGYKFKDIIGIPWMLAFSLRAAGWYLRTDIVWSKPNPMPESVTDRPTRAHEFIFLLSKSERYFYDYEAVKQPVAKASIERWSQNLEYQIGSSRGNGGRKTNETMKAVGGPRRSDKQRGHGRRHNGFNDRWDKMSVAEQRANGANLRTVWTVSVRGFKGAHFATFPSKLIEPCILAGCPVGGIVGDPFLGSGTTAVVAAKLGRQWVGIELNPKYVAMAYDRLGLFAHMGASDAP